MDWTELVVTARRAEAEAATAVCTALADGGLYIEDYADLEEQVHKIAHVDLIEQELLERPRDIVKLHLYISPDENAAAATQRLQDALLAAGVNTTLESRDVKQEDWENAWKQYYHPFSIGRRLAVAPSWEDYRPDDPPQKGAPPRVVLRLDPGMAFGTGTHETTALCLTALDELVAGGEAVLDVGCGSGILAIAALLLGAAGALGVDIDPMAVRTAQENAELNGVQDRFAAKTGDLAALAKGNQYRLITANIVADAIIRLAPAIPPLLAEGGRFIASGIIAERAEEVAAALGAAGLAVVEDRRDKGWVMLLCRRAIDN